MPSFMLKAFWRPELQDIVKQLRSNPSQALQVLEPLIMQGKAIQDRAWCLSHERNCKLKTARRHVAGSMCTPYSQRGAGRKDQDAAILELLAWLAQRRLCQEPDITHENVKDGPTEIVKRFLGDMYYLDQCEIDSVLFGIRAGRLRSFLKLRHKLKVLECISPLNEFVKRFVRGCTYDLLEHFYMTSKDGCVDGVMQREAWEVLKWAQSRQSSKAFDLEDQLQPDDEDAYFKVLSDTEKLGVHPEM